MRGEALAVYSLLRKIAAITRGLLRPCMTTSVSLVGPLRYTVGARKAHAAMANHRRISARGTTPARSAMIIPPRKSTKYGMA